MKKLVTLYKKSSFKDRFLWIFLCGNFLLGVFIAFLKFSIPRSFSYRIPLMNSIMGILIIYTVFSLWSLYKKRKDQHICKSYFISILIFLYGCFSLIFLSIGMHTPLMLFGSSFFSLLMGRTPQFSNVLSGLDYFYNSILE